MKNLSLKEADKLVNYIKEYKSQVTAICITINKIINVKKENELSEKIEKELLLKMLPIMCIYRTLLIEKYNFIEEND